MAIIDFHQAVRDKTPLPGNPELLLSAALHLMSHYSARSPQDGPCLKLASVIERHLKALAALTDLSPVLRATCQQLAEHWETLVEAQLEKPKKTRGNSSNSSNSSTSRVIAFLNRQQR